MRSQRQQKMLEENTKRVALEKKVRKEKLPQLHLFTSSDELKEVLAIEETITTAQKKNTKIELLKTNSNKEESFMPNSTYSIHY